MWKKVLRNDAFCGIMPEIAAEQKGSRNPEVPADIVILFGLMILMRKYCQEKKSMSRMAWHHLNMAGIVSSKNRVN